MEENPNFELAEEYFRVATTNLYSLQGTRNYKKQREKIENSSVDICAFYEEHKSLETLKVEGIGKQTIKKLEIILKLGAEEALRKIKEEKDRKLEESMRFGSRQKRPFRKSYFD